MSKTKPIGVRFDEEVLKEMKSSYNVDSPQQALNFLCDFWDKNKKLQIENKVPTLTLESLDFMIGEIKAQSPPSELQPRDKAKWRFEQRMKIADLKSKNIL